MDLGAAAHIVFRRIDVAAGMQPHMDAADDLAGAPGRVMLLDHLHGELHVLLEPRRRAHGEILRIEFEADVDDGHIGRQHGGVLALGRGANENGAA